MTGDPGWVEERDGNVVVTTPCDCRSEVVLDRAQVQVSRWQACPGCGRRWRLYVLGSGRVVGRGVRRDTAGPVTAQAAEVAAVEGG
ncbi:MAG: hypothetical protein ACRDYA_03920 [Egibacteraceae bacterium]